MGYVVKNGINYSGDNSVSLTQAQYDALVQAGTVDPNTTYFIINRNTTGATYAAGIAYDNTTSGLSATNVQSAIDEVNSRNAYSTVEHVVGTWVDGKPIYEVTIRIDNPQYSTTDFVDATTINNVDVCISTSSIWYRTVSSNLFYYSAVGVICPEKGTTNYQIGTRFKKDTSKVQYLNTGYNQQMQTVWITVQYTKTTD